MKCMCKNPRKGTECKKHGIMWISKKECVIWVGSYKEVIKKIDYDPSRFFQT